ncbi:Bifunctional purine biosynthetic protein ADE5,7 [Microbotryomycetes sp. JL221]|nr:Bifunctional purine biosynthetic protein ADE5,7 [Microbotryomycetes sp. JL221]
MSSLANASTSQGVTDASNDDVYVCNPLEDGTRKFRVTVLISGSGSNLAALMSALPNKLSTCQIVKVISNSKDAFGLERARQHEPYPIPCMSFSPFQFQKSRPDLFQKDEQEIKNLSNEMKQDPKNEQLKQRWIETKRILTNKVKPLYQLALADQIKSTKPDLIVLAGFMLILLPQTLERLTRDWIESDSIEATGTTTTLGKSPYRAQCYEDGQLTTGTPIPIINLHPALPGSFVGPHVIEDAWEAFNQIKLPSTKDEWERLKDTVAQKRMQAMESKDSKDDKELEVVTKSLASSSVTDSSNVNPTTTTTTSSSSSFGPRIDKTGIMIHRVIPELDRGEPVLWRQIEMKPGEWIDDLKTRIHQVEHEAIVDAVKVVTDHLRDGTWWK